MTKLLESTLNPDNAVLDQICLAGDPWMATVRAGQTFRILDLEGNQAVDTLFYSAANAEERYSAADTIARNGQLYLGLGSKLYSSEGRVMLTITADTCGRYDTLGGACSSESNTVRYALDKRPMHSCRDSFMHAICHCRGCSVAGNSISAPPRPSLRTSPRTCPRRRCRLQNSGGHQA